MQVYRANLASALILLYSPVLGVGRGSQKGSGGGAGGRLESGGAEVLLELDSL